MKSIKEIIKGWQKKYYDAKDVDNAKKRKQEADDNIRIECIGAGIFLTVHGVVLKSYDNEVTAEEIGSEIYRMKLTAINYGRQKEQK